MDAGLLGLAPLALTAAVAVTLAASFVKGAVGFAMPMIMISGLATFLPAETALAALVIPTLLSNVQQAFRGGVAAAVDAARRFRRYLIIVVVMILMSAQLVRVLPQSAMFLLLGVPITGFAVLQLMGWRLHIPPHRRRRAEAMIATFAGFVGGVSGVWGPPTVAYLTALDTPKVAAMRIQGVIYGLGSVALLVAHLKSGVLNATTLPLSAGLVLPALVGVWLGRRVHDRMDQERFRTVTLVVLVIAGANLIRRGLIG